MFSDPFLSVLNVLSHSLTEPRAAGPSPGLWVGRKEARHGEPWVVEPKRCEKQEALGNTRPCQHLSPCIQKMCRATIIVIKNNNNGTNKYYKYINNNN